ncbi:MAG: mechanosensitive ion channel [Lachnospiraceae bacterium]|nr:mechanosensitive ion channel [Lachnospiraceae bacterium]
MDSVIEYLKQLGTDVGLKIIFGILVLFIGFKIARWVVKMVSKGKAFTKLDKSVQSFLLSFIKIILYSLVVASVAIIWGIPTTSFMTVFTSAGVAIGLALQGALSNFAGGLMILIFKPFKIGDFIENGAVMGTVKDITIIYTILYTVDNKVITIPNGTLTNSNVINYSALPQRRVDIKFSAGYHDDIDKVKSVLMSVAEAHEKVLKDPAPFIRLTAQAASSLDYTFRVWVNGADYWEVYFDMMERVKKAFDENGICIPFQQVDVHMDK